MKGYLKSVVTLGSVISVVLVCGTAVLSYRGSVDQVETSDGVTHTHIVLEKLETLRAATADAESARRGSR
jgi:CHASE3 domain sensor protein